MVVQRLLRDREPLSGEVADWVSDCLKGDRSRPTTPGRKRSEYRRDQNIIVWIMFNVSPDFLATRNKTLKRASLEEPCFEGGSACDVVGVALGLNKYATVEKIWTNRRKRPPLHVLTSEPNPTDSVGLLAGKTR